MGQSTNQLASIKDLVPRGYVKLFGVNGTDTEALLNLIVTYNDINNAGLDTWSSLFGLYLLADNDKLLFDYQSKQFLIYKFNLPMRLREGGLSATAGISVKVTTASSSGTLYIWPRLVNPNTNATVNLYSNPASINLANTSSNQSITIFSEGTTNIFADTDVLYLVLEGYTTGAQASVMIVNPSTTLEFAYTPTTKCVKYSDFSSKNIYMPWSITIYNDKGTLTGVNTVKIGYSYKQNSSDTTYTTNYLSQTCVVKSGNIAANSKATKSLSVVANPHRYQSTVPYHAQMCIWSGTAAAKLGIWLYLRKRGTTTWVGPYKATNSNSGADDIKEAEFSNLISMTGLSNASTSEWATTKFPCSDGNKNWLFTLYKYDAAWIVVTSNYSKSPSTSAKPQ